MKPVKLNDDTHMKLGVLKAEEGHGSFDETIKYLLKRNEILSYNESLEEQERAESGKEAGEVLRDEFGRCSAEDFAEVIRKNVKRMEEEENK